MSKVKNNVCCVLHTQIKPTPIFHWVEFESTLQIAPTGKSLKQITTPKKTRKLAVF